jgi:hypothetical protein
MKSQKAKFFGNSKTLFSSKTIVSLFLIALLSMLAFAHEHEDEIAEGKALVDSNISCAELTDDQLEEIGEYFMEQMHPGEAHEQMHVMMGVKEDTPEHEQLHVHIARMMYCGKGMMDHGMMGGMMPMMRGGMMSRNYAPGIMDYRTGGMMGPGMMGGWTNSWSIASILWIILLAGFVVAVWLWVFKLFKETFGKKK